MTEARRQRRKVDQLHIVLPLLTRNSKDVQGVQETVFVGLQTLQLDQHQDVSFNERLAEFKEFLERESLSS